MTIPRAPAWLAFSCVAVVALGLSAAVARVFFDRETDPAEVLFYGGPDDE
jgi:hypothetical protein